MEEEIRMELMDKLEQLFTTTYKRNLEELNEAIASLGDTVWHVPNYRTEPSKLPYGRNVLLRNDDYEVIVINLPGNVGTAIHDHGDSIGCAFIVQGELHNITYKLDSNGYPLQNDEFRFPAGMMLESPLGLIHEMRNPRREAMISLHVYSPPLQNIQSYVPYSEVLDFVI
jgi:cysteine dioxygenase